MDEPNFFLITDWDSLGGFAAASEMKYTYAEACQIFWPTNSVAGLQSAA